MIKIRQNPYIGGLMMLVGMALVALGLSRGEILFYILAGVQLMLGTLWLSLPVVIITPTEFVIKNLLGMTMRSYEHGGLKNIKVAQPYVYIEREGQRARVKGINKKYLHGGDWAQMEQVINKLN